jgi:hypothetical protein
MTTYFCNDYECKAHTACVYLRCLCNLTAGQGSTTQYTLAALECIYKSGFTLYELLRPRWGHYNLPPLAQPSQSSSDNDHDHVAALIYEIEGSVFKGQPGLHKQIQSIFVVPRLQVYDDIESFPPTPPPKLVLKRTCPDAPVRGRELAPDFDDIEDMLEEEESKQDLVDSQETVQQDEADFLEAQKEAQMEDVIDLTGASQETVYARAQSQRM